MNVSDHECAYAAEFVSAGLSALTRRYIIDHPEPDRDELYRLALKMMSGGEFK